MAEKPKTDDKSAADQQASFAERETALSTREKELEEREKKLAADAAAARHADNVSFAEGLVKEAKLAPAGKDLVIGVMDALGDVPEDSTASFGEGDAGKITPVAAFKKLLEGAGTVVSLGEAASVKKGKSAAGTASFAAPYGYSVRPEDDALYVEAKRIQSANSQRPFLDCVREASATLGV